MDGGTPEAEPMPEANFTPETEFMPETGIPDIQGMPADMAPQTVAGHSIDPQMLDELLRALGGGQPAPQADTAPEMLQNAGMPQPAEPAQAEGLLLELLCALPDELLRAVVETAMQQSEQAGAGFLLSNLDQPTAEQLLEAFGTFDDVANALSALLDRLLDDAQSGQAVEELVDTPEEAAAIQAIREQLPEPIADGNPEQEVDGIAEPEPEKKAGRGKRHDR